MAPTQALTQKVGRLELADQGSLFLDEIGDIPLEFQPKLLRVVQEREFERLGSTVTRKVNVRVVAATHRHLEEMIRKTSFPATSTTDSMFFRFTFLLYENAPRTFHRSRGISREFARRMNKTIDAIPSETMNALTRYPWPGNVRELQNVIERSVVIHQKGNLSVKNCCLSLGLYHRTASGANLQEARD